MTHTNAVFTAAAEWLKEHNGTDLLFTVGSPVAARVDGQMRPINDKTLDSTAIHALIGDLLPVESVKRYELEKELDFSIEAPDEVRFRGNAFHQKGSPAVALRAIPLDIPSTEFLGLPDALVNLADLPQGFILVTGPTGAGKSTTLASLVDRINEKRQCHILTIEDPIEYVHNHRNSFVSQREIGDDATSFARALRSALREDPDVLLVGEMRDPESIATALTIAETGHLVFATLHTNDASQALDRIVDVFPAEAQQQIRVQLSSSLAGIAAQRLIPRIGGGIVAAFELLVATPAVRNLIKEGKANQIRNVIMTGQEHGMQTLESSLAKLVNEGLISLEDALGRASYPAEVTRALRTTG